MQQALSPVVMSNFNQKSTNIIKNVSLIAYIRLKRKLGRKLFSDQEIFNIWVKTRSRIEYTVKFNYY